MGLIKRVRTAADAHISDFLDRFEDPEKMLRLKLARINELIFDLKVRLCESDELGKRTQSGISDAEAKADKWHRRAEDALRSKDEKPAREALVEKKRFADLAAQLKERTSMIKNNNRELKLLLRNLLETKARLELKIALFVGLPFRKGISFAVPPPHAHTCAGIPEGLEGKIIRAQAELKAAYLFEDEQGQREVKFRKLEEEREIEEELKRMRCAIASDRAP